MATINYTTEEHLADGVLKVEWTGLGPGDVGQPFECQGLELASLHYWGDFNSNTGLVLMYGSNQITLNASDFGELIYSNAPRFQLPPDGRTSIRLAAILPKADANMIDGNVSLLFIKKD
jgi:hypothetical protein